MHVGRCAWHVIIDSMHGICACHELLHVLWCDLACYARPARPALQSATVHVLPRLFVHRCTFPCPTLHDVCSQRQDEMLAAALGCSAAAPVGIDRRDENLLLQHRCPGLQCCCSFVTACSKGIMECLLQLLAAPALLMVKNSAAMRSCFCDAGAPGVDAAHP